MGIRKIRKVRARIKILERVVRNQIKEKRSLVLRGRVKLELLHDTEIERFLMKNVNFIETERQMIKQGIK
ncbi:hypothetical protein PGLA_22610 [Paenibacillus glacialis]|uniref:Uncharacterized protein n=1 Tax=Paenibacillus glacialis TaxID=494026 RepID=A0A168E9Y1_9BACL|nr:hypothetical protein PGLA_22610 [Paenibacillus glacialis]